jgi:RimJ/RimL family protein N-acetyltransferase
MIKNQFQIRKANISDSDLLFNWRNEIKSRYMSINQSKLNFKDHKIWLSTSLKNPNRKIFIAVNKDDNIGMGRIDLEENGSSLSWVVSPNHRKKGYGIKIVSALIKLAALPIFAKIKCENEASKKIAEKLGFKIISKNNNIYTYRYDKNGD